jgi:hypothetical protein
MNRVDKLLELLTQRTLEDKVSWQETDFADTYRANFGKYSVVLSPIRTRDGNLASIASSLQRAYGQQDRYIPHALEIYDSQDRLIEEIGKLKPDSLMQGVVTSYYEDTDPALSYSMKKLYEAVKRQFDEPSVAIDALIEALE